MGGIEDQENVDAPPDGVSLCPRAEDAFELEEDRCFGEEHCASVRYFGEVVPLWNVSELWSTLSVGSVTDI